LPNGLTAFLVTYTPKPASIVPTRIKKQNICSDSRHSYPLLTCIHPPPHACPRPAQVAVNSLLSLEAVHDPSTHLPEPIVTPTPTSFSPTQSEPEGATAISVTKEHVAVLGEPPANSDRYPLPATGAGGRASGARTCVRLQARVAKAWAFARQQLGSVPAHLAEEARRCLHPTPVYAFDHHELSPAPLAFAVEKSSTSEAKGSFRAAINDPDPLAFVVAGLGRDGTLNYKAKDGKLGSSGVEAAAALASAGEAAEVPADARLEEFRQALLQASAPRVKVRSLRRAIRVACVSLQPPYPRCCACRVPSLPHPCRPTCPRCWLRRRGTCPAPTPAEASLARCSTTTHFPTTTGRASGGGRRRLCITCCSRVRHVQGQRSSGSTSTKNSAGRSICECSIPTGVNST
jgi:hypothetical protein